jgi:hypothetical protein
VSAPDSGDDQAASVNQVTAHQYLFKSNDSDLFSLRQQAAAVVPGVALAVVLDIVFGVCL